MDDLAKCLPVSPQENGHSNSDVDRSPERNSFDTIVLKRGIADYVDVVAVRNTSPSAVMFKIKTTSPEKFRVRPSTGCIAAGSTDIIRVYLQSG
ncbi:unnamed protein product [Nippostrongylus brasiliensis]|uniref:MSP domain-containing protein n=1 Tax=Nippostrongylus brasiliensis TaxID=27835 RepID=A0A0N4YYH8_NIPBR|nr:unnamed protein product [Nippostrongylus brasiliensis]